MRFSPPGCKNRALPTTVVARPERRDQRGGGSAVFLSTLVDTNTSHAWGRLLPGFGRYGHGGRYPAPRVVPANPNVDGSSRTRSRDGESPPLSERVVYGRSPTSRLSRPYASGSGRPGAPRQPQHAGTGAPPGPARPRRITVFLGPPARPSEREKKKSASAAGPRPPAPAPGEGGGPRGVTPTHPGLPALPG